MSSAAGRVGRLQPAQVAPLSPVGHRPRVLCSSGAGSISITKPTMCWSGVRSKKSVCSSRSQMVREAPGRTRRDLASQLSCLEALVLCVSAQEGHLVSCEPAVLEATSFSGSLRVRRWSVTGARRRRSSRTFSHEVLFRNHHLRPRPRISCRLE